MAKTNALTSLKACYAIFADSHQFYLWDARVGLDVSVCPPADRATRLRAAPGLIVIEARSNAAIAVDFELTDDEPPCDFRLWDHVVEASLDLPSGELEIHECVGRSIDRVDVAPGSYRVRACFAGLAGAAGGDHYQLILWPAAFAPVAVRKRFGATGAG